MYRHGYQLSCAGPTKVRFLNGACTITKLNLRQRGGDVAQLVRASDRHADAGLIPQCSEGFFSQSQLSGQTLL